MTHSGDHNPAPGFSDAVPRHGEAPARAGSAPAPGYALPVDAIVLAGTHQNARRLIDGHNKAFLEIDGRPLVRHVVDALVAAQQVGQVFVVGPPQELAAALAGAPGVNCVPQEGKMLTNSWAAIRAAEARLAPLPEAEVFARPLLIISSDLPLISARAIDDFIARCAATDAGQEPGNAMLVGVAEYAGLAPYYGDSSRPGIQRPLVHVETGRMRLANIYIARPRHLAHQEFLQTSFSYRKAKDWRNVLKLVVSLFRQHGGWSAAWMILRLQAASMLSANKGRLYRSIRAGNTMERVEQSVSTVLGGPVRVVVTPFGGLSLDVDDPEDYRLLSEHYREWMQVMEAVET
jgi:GTP:adenosylcobinamide-phosphate guanylyltransferase